MVYSGLGRVGLGDMEAPASYLGVLLGVSQLGIAAAAVISVSFLPRILLTASTDWREKWRSALGVWVE